jgi:4-hydroxybenzoate-CoA ligase
LSDLNGNAAVYFVDRHAHGALADKPAFIEGERRLTYGELANQSDRMAGLYATHSLEAEDRVALVILDTIDFPIIFWGSLKAGVVPIPINTLLATDIYEAIFRDAAVKALFVSKALLGTVEPAIRNAPSIRAVFVIGEGDTGGGDNHPYQSFADDLAGSSPSPTNVQSPDQVAFWLYSSGSTGRPKGVKHVHASLRATSDTYGADVLGIHEGDVIFSAAKLFFAYGLGNGMTFPMSVGATTVLNPGRPTPDAVAKVFAQARPTIFCGVPTLYAAMLAAFDGQVPAGFDRLRRCISAGEALPEEVGLAWKRLTDVDILDGVGSTEMLHIFLSNLPGDIIYGTSGVAVPGYEVRLVDETGTDVPFGGIGELLVNGPSAAEGYWNQRATTRRTFEGAWTRTGDKYERRADGRLVYCGRTDDMFKVSGIWVSPFEIEQALVGHASVLEAAVVARRDEQGLEKPQAFVVLKRGVDASGVDAVLKDYIKDKVGKWKYPRWVEIVDELPKTATGKIQRFKLRQMEGRQ